MKLSDVSPIAGIATGKGFMGELAGKGMMGLLPAAIARDAQKNDEEEKKRQAATGGAAPAGAPMKKGGKVGASKMGSVKTSKPAMSSASRRADGIATKGKTRGRFV